MDRVEAVGPWTGVGLLGAGIEVDAIGIDESTEDLVQRNLP
jgi:hypothetical protein